MAPQDDLTAERAAKFLKQHFPETLKSTGEPFKLDIDKVVELLKTARQEALREAAKEVRTQKADDKVADDLNQTLSFDTYNMTLESIASALDRLASEGS